MASKSPEVLASNGLGGLEDGNTTDDAVECENEKLPEENHQRECNMERTWGFSLEEIFSVALRFFKEMNGKAFSPTYEENLRLVALQKHISLGPYNPKDSPEVGFFDVLGNDRRREWERLGSMTKEDAMEDFVKLLNSCCSQFAPYVTSHKIEKEEQEKKRLREEEEHFRAEIEAQERRWQEEQCQREEEEMRKKEEIQRREEAECSVMELQKKQIMEALNAQTAVQFQQYAQQQLPNSPAQQHLLIQQLQEQHYQQYIQQAYQVQQTTLQKQQDSSVTQTTPPCSGVQDSVVNPGSHSKSTQSPESNKAPKQGHLFIEGKPGEVAIMAPSMWTRPQIKDFKEKMVQDDESVITVGRGEVLTVRVSTHDDGSYLFWEFATDHYDIGFGLYFEWPNTHNGTRTDNLESPVDAQETGQDGNEKCVNPAEHRHPQLSEVVPVYRRDSHEEVYAGSHQYPGHGVYLLKFDNSYSLWRSKVVYYRVYYTR